MKTCKLYLNYAGYCVAKANHAVKGDDNKKIKFHALFGLIQHPELGWILFDTGYTERFFSATKNFPNKLYALLTKVTINKHEELANQLKSNGISPNHIKHIIISHFHADHIGGLHDFANATIYCSKVAYQQAMKTSSLFSFAKGILKDLIPKDIKKRIKFVEEMSEKVDDPIFKMKYDLFLDGSIFIYHLPGHAAGQIGILLQTKKAKYFLIADACWDERAYQYLKLPHPIVKTFFHSWKDYKESILKIKLFHEQFPAVIIVPTHCEKSTSKLIHPKKIYLDAL